jgi:hypothetical protein
MFHLSFSTILFVNTRFMGYVATDEECGASCICKVPIKYCYQIRNKITGVDFIIGNICRRHWDKSAYDEEYENEEGKAVKQALYRCRFCRRKKKNGEDCQNCVGKKRLIEIFESLKENARENKEKREKERILKINKVLAHWKKIVQRKQLKIRSCINKWRNTVKKSQFRQT